MTENLPVVIGLSRSGLNMGLRFIDHLKLLGPRLLCLCLTIASFIFDSSQTLGALALGGCRVRLWRRRISFGRGSLPRGSWDRRSDIGVVICGRFLDLREMLAAKRIS